MTFNKHLFFCLQINANTEHADSKGYKIPDNKQIQFKPSFVEKAEDYKYSCAKNIILKKGLLEVCIL
jgi:hypothetical protein